MKVGQIIYLRYNQRWCKRHINGHRFHNAVCPRSKQPLSTLCTSIRGIRQCVTDNPCHTHCVPTRTESGLGCQGVIHYYLSTMCDIAVSGEVLEMVRLEKAGEKTSSGPQVGGWAA